MRDLWMLSAIINTICAFALIAFAVRLTQGAGFSCKVALTRAIHRFAICVMCAVMLFVALAEVQARSIGVPEWFWFQLCFLIVLAISIYRHLDAPAIPKGARWGRPIESTFRLH